MRTKVTSILPYTAKENTFNTDARSGLITLSLVKKTPPPPPPYTPVFQVLNAFSEYKNHFKNETKYHSGALRNAWLRRKNP